MKTSFSPEKPLSRSTLDDSSGKMRIRASYPVPAGIAMPVQDLSHLSLRPDEKRAFRINEFCAVYGLGRTKTYELIKAGKLRTVLVGGRRLVPKDAAEALFAQSEDTA